MTGTRGALHTLLLHNTGSYAGTWAMGMEVVITWAALSREHYVYFKFQPFSSYRKRKERPCVLIKFLLSTSNFFVGKETVQDHK